MNKVLATLACSAMAFAFAANAQDLLIVHGMAPAFGGDVAQRQVAIKIADINPADKDGAAALYARIAHAADVVCTGGSVGKSTVFAGKIAKCRKQAIAQAVKDVGTPELAAVAAAQ